MVRVVLRLGHCEKAVFRITGQNKSVWVVSDRVGKRAKRAVDSSCQNTRCEGFPPRHLPQSFAIKMARVSSLRHEPGRLSESRLPVSRGPRVLKEADFFLPSLDRPFLSSTARGPWCERRLACRGLISNVWARESGVVRWSLFMDAQGARRGCLENPDRFRARVSLSFLSSFSVSLSLSLFARISSPCATRDDSHTFPRLSFGPFRALRISELPTYKMSWRCRRSRGGHLARARRVGASTVRGRSNITTR